MASRTPDQSEPSNQEKVTVKEVELLRVLVSRAGQAVSAEWAIHPQLKHDLRPEEWREVVELMGKVTHLVGGRFKQILAKVEPDAPGNA